MVNRMEEEYFKILKQMDEQKRRRKEEEEKKKEQPEKQEQKQEKSRFRAAPSDHYLLLGLQPGGLDYLQPEEVNKKVRDAFNLKLRDYHEDREAGLDHEAAERIRQKREQLLEALDVLTNRRKRAVYDQQHMTNKPRSQDASSYQPPKPEREADTENNAAVYSDASFFDGKKPRWPGENPGILIRNALIELGILNNWEMVKEIMQTERLKACWSRFPRSNNLNVDQVIVFLQETNLRDDKGGFGWNGLMSFLREIKKRYQNDSAFKDNVKVQELLRKIP